MDIRYGVGEGLAKHMSSDTADQKSPNDFWLSTRHAGAAGTNELGAGEKEEDSSDVAEEDMPLGLQVVDTSLVLRTGTEELCVCVSMILLKKPDGRSSTRCEMLFVALVSAL